MPRCQSSNNSFFNRYTITYTSNVTLFIQAMTNGLTATITVQSLFGGSTFPLQVTIYQLGWTKYIIIIYLSFVIF